MVARKFLVHYSDSVLDVDYDPVDGFEVFKFQLFSLTSIPPDDQKILNGNDHRVISDDSDLVVALTNELKLVSIDEEDKSKQRELTIGYSGSSAKDNDVNLISDEELARRLQAEEESLMFQQFLANDQSEQFEKRIRPQLNQVQMYEDPVCQLAARKTVPVEELEEKALVSLAKEGNFKPSKIEQDHAFLLQLLFWFKESFRWVNAPLCDGCGSDTVNQGMGPALASEIQFGATRVEIYRCNYCSKITRFPRYNDPLKLLETRRGRCGEWANCFTLYCRAFGYESRLEYLEIVSWYSRKSREGPFFHFLQSKILDFTDHVWTECFSQVLRRWMHLDPCEGTYDKPLLYEKGWGKKLNYVIAIAKDGVYDVTKRYTRKWLEVLSRRNIVTESVLSATLHNLTKEVRRSYPPEVVSLLEDRDREESQEIERGLGSTTDSSVSLPGRQSGDKEWRISRSEIGSNEYSSFSCLSCPIRVCVDEHVTKICNSLFSTFSQFLENSFPRARIVEILKSFMEILVILKNLPYKTRRTAINPFVLYLLPYFDELIDALSLRSEIDTDEKVYICLAGDPVKTSLALPVVLDALDDLILYLDKCDKLTKDFLSFPLVRLHRIHSGSVLATGEELPFGIATSAFDGLRATKWEEPNGAKGCWLTYKLPDNQTRELVAYDIMSANDAPERDPMEWVVEGSNDGGASWHILDRQVSQVFENRFQRKLFEVKSEGFVFNFFRFRFLAVKDAQSNSRLQLGCIDLYARSASNDGLL